MTSRVASILFIPDPSLVTAPAEYEGFCMRLQEAFDVLETDVEWTEKEGTVTVKPNVLVYNVLRHRPAGIYEMPIVGERQLLAPKDVPASLQELVEYACTRARAAGL